MAVVKLLLHSIILNDLNLWKHIIHCKCYNSYLIENTWNHLTMGKKVSSDSFNDDINKMCLQIIFKMSV